MAAVGVVVAVLATLLSGTFDGVLQRVLGPDADAPNTTDIAATPVPDGSAEDPGAANAKIGERIIPVFDLVRVEPSGDAVIAGQGAPNSEVEIFADGGVIAKGKTNTTGEWAVVLEDPLAAGAHDIKVRSKATDGSELVSEQSVAVSVPEGGSGEVLVILNQPGTASEVLQVPGVADAGAEPPDPAAPPPAAETVVAALDPATEPTAVPTPDMTTGQDADAVPATEQPAAPTASEPPATATPSEPPLATATPLSIAELPVPPTVPSDDATGPADAPSAGVQTDELPTETPSGVAASDAAVSVGESATPAVTSAEPTTPPVVSAETGEPAQIAAEPAVDAAAPGAAVLQVTGEEPAAVEPDPAAPAGEQSVPSVAAPGETIVIAAAPPADAGAALQAAEVIQPNADAGEATAGEAISPASTPSADGTAGQAVAAMDPVDPAAAPPQPAAPVSVDAVELENGERFFAAGAAAPGAVLRLYVDGGLTEETRAMDTGRWLVDSTVPLDPGDHTVRVDHVAPDGSVLARAEVPFEILEDLAAGPTGATGIGSTGAGSGITGEARVGDAPTLIIRRGDNLWRIARRLYGSGVRYSTIYQANTDQIGNPDLIYPGQVFVVPQGDRNWEPAATSIE